MSVLQKLTEGIVNRNLQKEGDALLDKWEKTGLLEGLEDNGRQGMAVLLENQAKELLREASSMAAGDVEGFAAVAFPIVRRVFGGLIANQLVSVQPMSLPSGLIFFMDFTYTQSRTNHDAGDSLYGGGVVASQLTGGVTDITEEGGGFYNLQTGYSSPTGSLSVLTEVTDADPGDTEKGEINNPGSTASTPFASTGTTIANLTAAQKRALRHDPDVLNLASSVEVFCVQVRLTDADKDKLNLDALSTLQINTDATNNLEADMGLTGGTLVRRLTERGYRDGDGKLQSKGDNYLSFYYTATTAGTIEPNGSNAVAVAGALKDTFQATELGSVGGADPWGLEEPTPGTGQAGSSSGKQDIPEIDIKVDSVAVTAVTKKLKAKWSPELAQDLNAYHNLDAEVELTSILSEQIALEIDREILNDLVQGATAGTFFWSRRPGRFVNRDTGADISTYSNESLLGADFTGTVSEWYETLVETINDISAQIHRKTLRGGANFIVVSPEAANILEFTAGFRASVTADVDTGSVGAVKVGALSKKWDVYVDPYFRRNVVLVGRKGNSFLESGYVYAPYVPLQVTPTIFGVEDFVPRKGVMTRYAKKMVRPDMYGLVVIKDFSG